MTVNTRGTDISNTFLDMLTTQIIERAVADQWGGGHIIMVKAALRGCGDMLWSPKTACE